VLVSSLAVLMSLAAVLLGSSCVLFGFVVSAVLVVVRGLPVMMCCGLVMAGRRVMVFGCGVGCCRGHCFLLRTKPSVPYQNGKYQDLKAYAVTHNSQDKPPQRLRRGHPFHRYLRSMTLPTGWQS
jgi:hypothetical protein